MVRLSLAQNLTAPLSPPPVVLLATSAYCAPSTRGSPPRHLSPLLSPPQPAALSLPPPPTLPHAPCSPSPLW